MQLRQILMIRGKISDNIKGAAGESIGYYKVKKKKPWFDDDCSNVVERRKQAKLKFLQDPYTKRNRDNYHTERRETCHTLRNKKRDYLKGKLNEIETKSKNKNIRDLYKGIKDFKKVYQARLNVIKNENEELSDSNSILNRWKNYFIQLLNVHKVNDVGEIQIQTAEPLFLNLPF